HRRSEPGQLVDRLAAHPEAHEERGELGRRRLAIHHRAHRRVGLVARQRPTLDDRDERHPYVVAHRAASARSRMPAVANEPVVAWSRAASPSPAWRRKFASRCGPSGVSTLSGWNWMPSSGSDTWRRPITTRSSSLIAVTRSSAGSVAGSTASEW